MTATFETTDHDEAAAHLEEIGRAASWSFSPSKTFRLRYEMRAGARTADGAWGLASASSNFELRLDPTDTVVVCRLRSGRARQVVGGEDRTLTAGDIFLATDTATSASVSWTDAECDMLTLPIASLRRAAAISTGLAPTARPAFSSRQPISAATGWRLAQVMTFSQLYLSGSPTTVGAAMSSVERLLAATVLTTFPNDMVADHSTPRPHATVPGTVASAMEFITYNADLAITAGDVAAHVAVTPRALQMAFRKYVSTSPSAFLRTARLQRIHDELADAAVEDGTSVAEVAGRWGFEESSRLVQHYRRAYGELPRETLRRRPR